MSIPQRVQREAEKADQMIQAARQQPPESDAANEAEQDGQQIAEQADQGASQSTELNQGESQSLGDASDAGADNGSTGDEYDAELERWKQRYRSLNGMFESQNEQLKQMRQLIANMQAATPAPEQGQEQSQKSDAQEKLITPDDESNFGADLIDMTRRAIREEQASLRSEMKAMVDELRKELSGVQHTTQEAVQDSFESKLDRGYPEWRNLDSDPAFIEWLQASQARQKVFAEAVQSRNVADTLEFFRTFAEQNKAKQDKAEAPKKQRNQQLEKQIAPGKSKSVQAQTDRAGEQKLWTRSEIAAVYQNRRQYKADEFARMEREIAKAQSEDRVDYTR